MTAPISNLREPVNPYASGKSPPLAADAPRGGLPHLRWWIAALLMAGSIMNYVDRQALSILAPQIQKQLDIDDLGYGRVTQVFLLCYTAMYLLSGRIVDRFGARLAETGFIVWWSLANMLTALAGGLTSLAVYRGLLGLAEPGHYSAAAKSVAEWFPPKDKAIAVGMYVMGGTLGAAIAAPLVSQVALHWNWRGAFIVTGALGLLVAAAWFVLYRRPHEHPWLTAREREYLREHGVLNSAANVAAKPTAWGKLFALRGVWLLMVARMLADSVWYFYLFWFSKYLMSHRGFTLETIGWLAVVFVAADLGSLAGGWISGRFIRAGVTPLRARLLAMCGAAAVLAGNFLVPFLPGQWPPLAAASVAAFAIMVWMTNSVTLPIDLFPSRAIGSIQGMIGTGGALGGMVTQGIIAWLVTQYSYQPVFLLLSLLHPLAAVILMVLLPGAAARDRESFSEE